MTWVETFGLCSPAARRRALCLASGVFLAGLLGCAGCPTVTSDDTTSPASDHAASNQAASDGPKSGESAVDAVSTDAVQADAVSTDAESLGTGTSEVDSAFLDFGADHPDAPRRRGDPQYLPAIDVRVGGHAVRVEIARNDPERQRGLMHRTDLGPDSGMLFCFPRTKLLSFWMQNTILPLSIAYVDESGVIFQIEQLKPFDESTVASVEQARFALEMNQGWFKAHGVVPGAHLEGLGVIFTTPSLKPE